MTKPRWQLALEEEATQLRGLAAQRREITAADPAADGLEHAAARLDAVVRRLLDPTLLLTPEQWAAEQEPPVAAATVRRWCRDGELEFVASGRGYLIPAGAVRTPGAGAVDDLAKAS